MTKLGKRLKIFLGNRYAVNVDTKEVHDLKNLHRNCHEELWDMESYWFVSRKQMIEMMQMCSGCKWCMRKV